MKETGNAPVPSAAQEPARKRAKKAKVAAAPEQSAEETVQPAAAAPDQRANLTRIWLEAFGAAAETMSPEAIDKLISRLPVGSFSTHVGKRFRALGGRHSLVPDRVTGQVVRPFPGDANKTAVRVRGLEGGLVLVWFCAPRVVCSPTGQSNYFFCGALDEDALKTATLVPLNGATDIVLADVAAISVLNTAAPCTVQLYVDSEVYRLADTPRMDHLVLPLRYDDDTNCKAIAKELREYAVASHPVGAPVPATGTDREVQTETSTAEKDAQTESATTDKNAQTDVEAQPEKEPWVPSPVPMLMDFGATPVDFGKDPLEVLGSSQNMFKLSDSQDAMLGLGAGSQPLNFE